jgi:hypothetical protein
MLSIFYKITMDTTDLRFQRFSPPQVLFFLLQKIVTY